MSLGWSWHAHRRTEKFRSLSIKTINGNAYFVNIHLINFLSKGNFMYKLHELIYSHFIIRSPTSFVNDTLGCNSVSWAPFGSLGSQAEDGTPVRRLVTGSCDNTVRFWQFIANKWQEEVKIASLNHSGKLFLFKKAYFSLKCFKFGRLGTRRCLGSQHSRPVQHCSQLL